jgi:hypothetical protein
VLKMQSSQRSFVAGEDIGVSLFVDVSGNHEVSVADVGSAPYGISHEGTREAPIPGVTPVHALEGESCMVYGPGDNCEVTSGEAVAAGDFLTVDSAGRAVVAGIGEEYYAQAVNTVAAANQMVKVTLVRGVRVGTTVLRVRATTAEVNAGLTLLAAIPGRSYRLHDASLISIGGAAGGATSVNIRGTQAASAVSLLAAAVAGLTQNTLLRAGATNAAILAGGASFIANDVNTPISLNATGTLTTSTHIDVLLNYTVE